MSAAIRPEVSPDIRFFDQKTAGRELPRWVFYPGDVIISRRKQEITWLRAGGEEMNSPCLFRYGQGFLPRGFIAPLQEGAEWISPDSLPPGVFATTGMEVNGELIPSRLARIPIYPGDAITNLMMTYMNDRGMRRGLVEITSLKGKYWSDVRSSDPAEKGFLDVLDEVYFGDGREPTLRGLEAQIKQGMKLLPESTEVGEQMLAACFEFGEWARWKLDTEHRLLRAAPTAGGEAPTYSPLAELLLVQLEMQRQDQPMKEMADQNVILGKHIEQAITKLAAQNGPSGQGFDLEAFGRVLAETLAANNATMLANVAEMVRGGAEEQPKMFTCEHCGEEMKLTAKSFHVNRHCRVLHPKTDGAE